MHTLAKIPLSDKKTKMKNIILKMSQKGFGCVGITNDNKDLVGIITDGDLRRNMKNKILDKRAEEIMVKNPKTILKSKYIKDALEVFDNDCLIRLGTCVAPVGKIKPNAEMAKATLTFKDGSTKEIVINEGSLEMIEFPYEPVTIDIQPSRGIDVGAGKGESLSSTIFKALIESCDRLMFLFEGVVFLLGTAIYSYANMEFFNFCKSYLVVKYIFLF